jgi:hypothetical protein
MADNVQPPGTGKHEQVVITSLPELTYWMRRLRAAGWQLRDGVAAVGRGVEDVQQYLRAPRSRPSDH